MEQQTLKFSLHFLRTYNALIHKDNDIIYYIERDPLNTAGLFYFKPSYVEFNQNHVFCTLQ